MNCECMVSCRAAAKEIAATQDVRVVLRVAKLGKGPAGLACVCKYAPHAYLGDCRDSLSFLSSSFSFDRLNVPFSSAYTPPPPDGPIIAT